MARYYYKNSISEFIVEENRKILGTLANRHEFNLEEQQRNSWNIQISLLKKWLCNIAGTLVFEYSIPRMGRRIDCVVISKNVIFAIEFKIGSSSYDSSAIDQVTDYALDLKNFHEQSHSKLIVPILICTEAKDNYKIIKFHQDLLAEPILTNGASLEPIIKAAENDRKSDIIDVEAWIDSIYKPTPTIIEAAQALYSGHPVKEITRSDAGAINLSKTASAVTKIIEETKNRSSKAICFLTGVPGAGKTLAGLNLANTWHNEDESEHAVFLSGNGPLVEVLQEALARNEVINAKENGKKIKKSQALSKAKAFIQNVHHFRDEALESEHPPIEKVVIFDEAQRAWTQRQTASFMKVKKGKVDFNQSEPEFLISYMNRHKDWATIICLVGGGQEINTGEAGLHEWFESINRSFPNWNIYVSSKLTDREYALSLSLYDNFNSNRLVVDDDLHLSVSVRSYRSENVAAFVKAVLDVDRRTALNLCEITTKLYPIFITRDLSIAKKWLRSNARGSERYGIIASSRALRLKPYSINVKNDIDPKNWFLNEKKDIRSSYYLEDVATEFDIQGLELDWVCVAWDADFRFHQGNFVCKIFRGTNWQDIKDKDARRYLKNAYRVLLTRARQGMIIFIPNGDASDPTRRPDYYDNTFEYLCSVGIPELFVL